MTLTLCRRPSSYATGQVEVLEDLKPYISQQAGVEGVDSNADVLLDATAFADDLATGLAHKGLAEASARLRCRRRWGWLRWQLARDPMLRSL
jgi:hypothetical protein